MNEAEVNFELLEAEQYPKIVGERFVPKVISGQLFQGTTLAEATAFADRAITEANKKKEPPKSKESYMIEFLVNKLCKSNDECCHWAYIARKALGDKK